MKEIERCQWCGLPIHTRKLTGGMSVILEATPVPSYVEHSFYLKADGHAGKAQPGMVHVYVRHWCNGSHKEKNL